MSTSKLFDYPRDSIWKDYLIDESRIHGARFNMHLYIDLVNEYTKPGDLILDPLGGIGSCFAALTLGRHVIMIELEERFVKIAELNLKHIRDTHPLSELSRATILVGDCRKILPLPQTVGVSHIITSPPYGASVHNVDKWELRLAEMFGSTTQSGYGYHPDQIGLLNHQLQRFALTQVYQKCYETLTFGGRMIIITKDSIKGGKVMEQGRATMQSCIDAGFELEIKHERQCSITARQRLHQKHTAGYTPIDREDIWCFKK